LDFVAVSGRRAFVKLLQRSVSGVFVFLFSQDLVRLAGGTGGRILHGGGDFV
jgi:hypothetical protein